MKFHCLNSWFQNIIILFAKEFKSSKYFQKFQFFGVIVCRLLSPILICTGHCNWYKQFGMVKFSLLHYLASKVHSFCEPVHTINWSRNQLKSGWLLIFFYNLNWIFFNRLACSIHLPNCRKKAWSTSSFLGGFKLWEFQRTKSIHWSSFLKAG